MAAQVVDATPPPAMVEGRYSVSPFNFHSGVLNDPPRPLIIFDSTIRKLLYTPGIRTLSPEQAIEIADALADSGIQAMNLNLHWWGGAAPAAYEVSIARAVLDRGYPFAVSMYLDVPLASRTQAAPGPSIASALEFVSALGAHAVELQPENLGDPADLDRQIAGLGNAMEACQARGLGLALGMPDVGRANFQYVSDLANAAIRLGVERIQLNDAYSSLTPHALQLWCTEFRNSLDSPVTLSLHVHNDFGMATACALAAVMAGVNPDAAVGGISYRAGFTSLEELAVALETLCGQPSGIQLEKLGRVSDLVWSIMESPIPLMKPISGPHAFLRDNPAAQIRYLLEGPDAFPPIQSCLCPSVVGARLTVVWGRHLSLESVRTKLKQMKLSNADGVVHRVRQAIESALAQKQEYPFWLTESEVEEICRNVAST